MKLSIAKETSVILKNAESEIERLNIDIKEDDFMIIQPFDNGNIILLEAEGKGSERTIRQKVFDGGIVLPKRNGTLDIFD